MESNSIFNKALQYRNTNVLGVIWSVENNVINNVKRLRELKNYTQEYMAEQLGITRASYNSVENGQTKLTIDRLFDIAKILETDVDTIMNFDKPGMYKQAPPPQIANEAAEMYQDYIRLLKEENERLKQQINPNTKAG